MSATILKPGITWLRMVLCRTSISFTSSAMTNGTTNFDGTIEHRLPGPSCSRRPKNQTRSSIRWRLPASRHFSLPARVTWSPGPVTWLEITSCKEPLTTPFHPLRTGATSSPHPRSRNGLGIMSKPRRPALFISSACSKKLSQTGPIS